MTVNTAALHSVPTSAVTGKYFRLIRQRYAHEPLSMLGALKEGQRYNVAGLFGALYLGFDKETCQAEVQGGILMSLPIKAKAYVLWDYQVKLQAVVRLDDDTICSAIGITQAEISVKGDHQWASLIGEPLYNRAVEGLVAPSAQKTGGKCLDVFLDHVHAPSEVVPLTRVEEWPP